MGYNKLTDPQAERLALLSEELGEVQQAIGKILRHGYDNWNPDLANGISNRNDLEKEIGHVLHAIYLMETNGDIDSLSIEESSKKKKDRVQFWLHYYHKEPDHAR